MLEQYATNDKVIAAVEIHKHPFIVTIAKPVLPHHS